MKKDEITGTLCMEKRTTIGDGRAAVLVFGVLAMPQRDAKEFCRDRPEQLMFRGRAGAGLLTLSHVSGAVLYAGQAPGSEEAADVKGMFDQMPVDRLFTSGIWRTG